MGEPRILQAPLFCGAALTLPGAMKATFVLLAVPLLAALRAPTGAALRHHQPALPPPPPPQPIRLRIAPRGGADAAGAFQAAADPEERAEAAIEMCRAALEEKPDRPKASIALALLLQGRELEGDLDEALELLEGVTASSSPTATPELRCTAGWRAGVLLERRGALREAEAAFRLAMEVEGASAPTVAAAFEKCVTMLLRAVHRGQRRADDAIDLSMEALQLGIEVREGGKRAWGLRGCLWWWWWSWWWCAADTCTTHETFSDLSVRSPSPAIQ